MKFMFFFTMLINNIMFNCSKFILYINSIMLMLISLIYMFSINYNNYWMLMYSWMGMDFFSFILSLLTIWIISMMFLVSLESNNKKKFSMILLILLMSLLISFLSMNYFMFYLYFEISLLPTFLLIMGWGYQPERIKASMFMLLYTLFASLPMLVMLFMLFNYYNSMNYLIILNKSLTINLKFLIYFMMIFAFLIKLPLFLFHMWLPKAHVEAPVSGSMILAAVMLKLGGYGIMRSMMMMINLSMKFNYLIILLSLLGMVFLSLICLRQMDMKILVAYSSVVHMGMMLMGIMSMMIWGFNGGYLMMLAHGFCSSALFILVNYLYERTKSRNIFINKGMMVYLPILSMWWFLFCICNMSAPISLNLLSEIMIISILLNWSTNIMMILMLGMYLSALYSLYLFSITQHGNNKSMLFYLFNNNMNNFILMIFHWIPLNLLIIKMDMLI